MAKDPFYYALDEEFRGTRVRVHTSEFAYEGWARMWHYDQHAILLHDVTRDDGEQFGAVTIDEPETVERLKSTGTIQSVTVEAIHPSPYSVRDHDDPDHRQFVRQTRERGHLLTFPTVRPLAAKKVEHEDGNEYETVGGHRRVEAARRANLTELPVRVADLDDWGATKRFVDEHIPIQDADERGNGLYSREEIDQALARLREAWPDEKLRDITTLAPYLKAKLGARRTEGIRCGYVTNR